MNQAYIYDSKLGKILIAEDGSGVTKVSILTESVVSDAVPEYIHEDTTYQLIETPLLKEASVQLNEYFEGNRTEFSIKLNPKGTEFQKKVWEALTTIPYGETRSYIQIAKQIGNDKASRAVGSANHNNPIPYIIPCHRVIGAKGKLVGYAYGLSMKEKLLKMEQERKNVHE
ncbi:MAG: methylated-DNA--[protein]-cysteine S-methyltransferase [Mobilitalea sp.]